ncbi:MAG: DNA polymerase IV [Ilumatobacteraceae bacterium]
MSAPRTILHVDMDAFFVSVELRRHPELVGQPVVVGGMGPRGVVAAASYEARRYGVFSAMPGSVARRKCPHAVFLSGDHELYSSVSRDVREILDEATPYVEPLSLDEAFLDVTGALRLLGDGVEIGHHIRNQIQSRLDLSCSVGVAPNKFLAKLASVAAKPKATAEGVRPGSGVFEVPRGGELAFLHPLAVQRLWGVGPATLEKLQKFGVATVGDLYRLGEQSLVVALGRSSGRHLYALSQAIDDRPVETGRAMKSIGHEETFARDLFGQPELRTELVRLSDAVASRLRAAAVGARTMTLKVRFAGFVTITRSVTLTSPVATAAAILDAVGPLLANVDPTPGVRLIGVHASNFGQPAEQLRLDDLFGSAETGTSTCRAATAPLAASASDWTEASAAIDAIRERFGNTAIGPASTVSKQGIRLVKRGSQQWGPDHDRDPAP